MASNGGQRINGNTGFFHSLPVASNGGQRINGNTGFFHSLPVAAKLMIF